MSSSMTKMEGDTAFRYQAGKLPSKLPMISSVARKAIAGLASNSFLGQRIRTLGRDPAFPEWPSYRASERWTPHNAVEVTNGAGGVVRISKVETPVDGVVVRLTII